MFLFRSLLFLLVASTGDEPLRDPALEVLNNEGVRYYESRLYHQAIEAFKKAYELDPRQTEVRSNLAWAWIGLGLELLNSGENAAAADAFNEALAVKEEFYARFGLGYVHFLDLDYDDAREELETVLRLNPTFSKAHKILALIRYRLGEVDKAMDLMKKATELDKEDLEAEIVLRRWTEEAKVTKAFKETGTEQFVVRYDPEVPAKLVGLMIQHLEGSYEILSDTLGHTARRRLVVGIFTEEGFHRATGAYHWVGGLFDGQIKVPVRAEDHASGAHRQALFRSLQHELTHALVKDVYPACPNWLNEGIAQFFELWPLGETGATARVSSSSPTPEENSRLRAQRRDDLQAQLRRGEHQRLPLAKIPSRLWEVSSESQARWSYLQGLGFVEFLAAEYHVFRLRLLLETAATVRSMGRAFQLTYGKTLAELEEAWWHQVLRQN